MATTGTSRVQIVEEIEHSEKVRRFKTLAVLIFILITMLIGETNGYLIIGVALGSVGTMASQLL